MTAGPDPLLARAVGWLTAQLPEAERPGRTVVAFGVAPVPAGAVHQIREVRGSVLAAGPDLVVFFDPAGRIIGWRDDGRLGAAMKPATIPEGHWAQVAAELELPAGAELRRTALRFIDPLGWTTEFRVRLVTRSGTDTLRAWANPSHGKVIQVLFPAEPVREGTSRTVAARFLVLRLLSARLKRAGIEPQPPHRFFVLTPGAEEPYAGGTQVRVATKRHWSDARAEFGPDDADPLGWRIDRLADSPVRSAPDRRAVYQLVERLVPPPLGATRPVVEPVGPARPERAWRVSWSHDEHGIVVDGDRFVVEIHPENRRVVAVRRWWRTVVPNLVAPVVTAAEARRAAEGVPIEPGLDGALRAGPPTMVFWRAPGAATDRLAWVVPFGDAAGVLQVVVDAEDAGILDRRGSR